MLKRLRWTLLWALVILVLCLIPGKELPRYWWTDLFSFDKVVHAGVLSAKVIGARTEVSPVIADLTRALAKIYARRGIRIEKVCPDGLVFRGDRADFEEMVGNLLDNACKWADEEVNVTVAAGGTARRLTVVVADDGPGLTDEQAKRVVERGERLDESKPGSGLGLSIVKEIAELYGGTMAFGRSEAGGLSVTLDLPAVAG